MAFTSHKDPLKKLENDPAILTWACSNKKLKRYSKSDLVTMKDYKLSCEPPTCLYKPAIIRLNILKYSTQHSEVIEKQMNAFREKLQNLSLQSWDPNILQLLNNYHNALLTTNMVSQQQRQQQLASMYLNSLSHQQQKHIQQSYAFNDPQKVVLDKIPSYDRNVNFFDNITTTATMRPPPPHYGTAAFAPHHKTVEFSTTNMNSFTKDTSAQNSALAKGDDVQATTNDSVKSHEKMELAINESIKVKSLENLLSEDEPEPEWFNYPASRQDFVDLKGFDEDSSNNGSANYNNNNNSFGCENQRKFFNNQYHNNSTGYRGRGNYNNRYNGQMNHNSSMQKKFRNPLHQIRHSGTPPSEFNMGQARYAKDQFFESWKNSNNPYTHPFNVCYKPNVSMLNMEEVENAMMQRQNLVIQNANQGAFDPQSVPQFFRNAAFNYGVRVNNISPQRLMTIQPLSSSSFTNMMPTQEQLQQHTDEIMRNAILRKTNKKFLENFQKQ